MNQNILYMFQLQTMKMEMKKNYGVYVDALIPEGFFSVLLQDERVKKEVL